MIKVLTLDHAGDFELVLTFSNGARGRFDGAAYLSTRQGPLLDPLRGRPEFRELLRGLGFA